MLVRPIAVAAMLLFACNHSHAVDSLESGRYSIKQSWSQEQNFQRPYLVRVPAHADGEKLPVFIFLHGNGGTAKQSLANLTGRYKELASRYVMVFPQGYAKSWNIVSETSKADDKQFVEAIIKHLASFDNVRAHDFSIMGNSNGAALVNQLAIESKLPHVRNFITSVSPLNAFQHNGKHFRNKGSSNDYQSVAQPATGIRLLNISGTKDRLIPYGGGPSPVIPANDGKLEFLDAEESIFVWAKQMGYREAKLTEPTTSADSIDEFDYLDGQVIHLRANGFGHNASKALSEKRLLSFLTGSRDKSDNETSDAIVRASTLPDSMPWDLAKLSVAPKYEWSDGDQVRSLFFQGESYHGKPTRVFAYYASPATINANAKAETYPGIVLVHGGGGTAFSAWVKLWAERGYAAIAMDLAGCGPERQRMDDGGPGQGHDMKFGTIDLPLTEQWTYHAVANVILSHSLLRSLPEVDSSRTALTGISWGGYLTCIVSGLDNRFDAAIPVYGCGFLHENSCWLGEFAAMTAENKAKWIKLWDPSKYVGSASMPMLFVNGGKDFAYPPDSHAKTFALVSSPKYLHFVPDLAHGHIFDRPNVIEPFVRQQLNGGDALAKISRPRIREGKVTATVDVNGKLTESTLHFTTDALSEDPRTRKWISRSATIKESSIESDPPPNEATAWFLTVKDERDLVTSTPLMFDSSSEP